MKSSKVLLKAMDVIATPDKWTKNAYARDSSGDAVGAISKDATCFCSLGALRKTCGYFENHAGLYLSKTLHADKSVPRFNDAETTTHSDVMKMFMTAYFLAVADGD